MLNTFKNKKWRGHEIIKPATSTYELCWEPEPFFADITSDGIIEHQTLEDPNSLIIISTTIPKVQFDRHAAYLAGKEYHSAVWQTLRYIESACPIYLMAESGDNNIYCLSAPMDIPVVFGRLLKNCEIYTMTIKSFKKFCNEL